MPWCHNHLHSGAVDRHGGKVAVGSQEVLVRQQAG